MSWTRPRSAPAGEAQPAPPQLRTVATAHRDAQFRTSEHSHGIFEADVKAWCDTGIQRIAEIGAYRGGRRTTLPCTRRESRTQPGIRPSTGRNGQTRLILECTRDVMMDRSAETQDGDVDRSVEL